MQIALLLSALVVNALAMPALDVKSHGGTPPGVVQMSVMHTRKHGRFGKRSLDDVYGSYSIVFEMGTPAQKMQALLDTGSSDLWVNTPKSGQHPSYDPQKSSTYSYNNSDFSIRYGSGSATGDWATDTVNIAGAGLKGQTFGVVSDSEAGEAIFGIGMVDNESSKTSYVNVPQNLKNQGHIKHNAYSLFLDNLDKSTGRVLFGGVDTEKYHGELLTVPFIDHAAFYIETTSIKVGEEQVSEEAVPTLLDSGTTFTYLPLSASKKVAEIYNATYDDMTGLYFVSEKRDSQPDFVFNFSGAEIKVPSKEMVVESSLIIEGDSPMPYVLGIVPTFTAPYILGDTFLRSSYAVYDLENRELSLAQSSYTQKSNIKVIKGEVPDAKRAPRVST